MISHNNISHKPYLGSTPIAQVWLGYILIYPEDTVDYSTQYLTFEVVDGGTIEFVATDESVSKTISYSLDNGKTWTDLTSSTSYQSMGGTLSAGDKVLVKGRNNTYASNNRGFYNHFTSTAKVNVYGNIMSLISGDDFVGNKTLTKINTFYRLFADNSKLLSAKHLILPATTLTSYCYANMFWNCANFTTAPKLLPATTLSTFCYHEMFEACTNLETAPELPATTLATQCYNSMFYNCYRLETAPELPATTLATYCYSDMFNGCTALTTAPELPATTLAKSCYTGMFYNCYRLETAPELPATTLATYCYSDMFNGCTALTTAPALPATTLASNCYTNMFRGCTSLNYIKAMFTTTPSTSYTQNWVNGVSSTGIFVKNSAATWNVTGVNGVPTGWTVVTE